MSSFSLLAVPSVEKGRGGGHLVRSVNLVKDLRSRGSDAFLYLPDGDTEKLPFNEAFDPRWIIAAGNAETKVWSFIVLDRWQTPAEEFVRWRNLKAPLIGIDEGGPCRAEFDFLIDLLPGLSKLPPPNLCAPSLLPLPKNRRLSFYAPPLQSAGDEKPPLKILVTFGAEDPAGLSALVIKDFSAPIAGLDISIVTTTTAGTVTNNPGIRLMPPQQKLREQLAAYDIVVTHFGLTAFEALHVRVPVILVSPGVYHEKLARSAGFFSTGIGLKGVRSLKTLLSGDFTEARNALARQSEKIAAKYNLEKTPEKSLASLFESPQPFYAGCPLCGDEHTPTHKVPARFPERSYRRCPRCGMIYMFRINAPPITYARDYFFDAYQKQYGKTYLEDFPHLTKMAKLRLRTIRRLCPPLPGSRLLDLGCAYGPFLAASKEEGYIPVGHDPAEDAVDYVNKTLNISAYRGFFPDDFPPELSVPETFEVITLWYVIEHFPDPKKALEKIACLLKPGGVLAISTPSASGISARRSQRHFLEQSPADHWTIWSPGRCRALLKRYGFEARKIIVQGHHPERFPFIGGLFKQRKGFFHKLFFGLSRLLSLGDTFEIYAVKTGGNNG